MENVIFFKRAFLNKEGYHSNAAIVCDIKCLLDEDDYMDPFWGHYKMSDCEKTIELSVDFGSVEDLDNTLYKLDNIISVTQAFRDSAATLRKDIEEYVERQKLKEEAKKEES